MTYDSDSIVKQGLSKDYNVQDFVNVDLLEDGQDGNGIYSHDQWGEQERLQNAGRVGPENASQTTSVQRGTWKVI